MIQAYEQHFGGTPKTFHRNGRVCVATSHFTVERNVETPNIILKLLVVSPFMQMTSFNLTKTQFVSITRRRPGRDDDAPKTSAVVTYPGSGKKRKREIYC